MTSAATPPIAGPSANPAPNAAPSNPSNRARSSGAETSVTAACATDTLAPLAPSTMRPRNSSHNSEPASPVSRLPTAVPTSDMMITGLRPTRSDSRPVSGEHTSWATENDATSAPAVAGDAPASRAKRASTGKRIPKPMRSRATVVQMTPKPGGSGRRDRLACTAAKQMRSNRRASSHALVSTGGRESHAGWRMQSLTH